VSFDSTPGKGSVFRLVLARDRLSGLSRSNRTWLFNGNRGKPKEQGDERQ
jgi:hypothetical protein